MDYDAVDAAIREGKLWRAKEILQGRLAVAEFDRELLRRYGELLLSMGDLTEAGRMLFCAGARDPEHHNAIALFLRKHPRERPSNFLAVLPSMVRRQRHLASYLASEDFERHGWSAKQLASIRPVQRKAAPATVSRLRRRVEATIAFGAMIFFVIALLVGIVTIARFVSGVF